MIRRAAVLAMLLALAPTVVAAAEPVPEVDPLDVAPMAADPEAQPPADDPLPEGEFSAADLPGQIEIEGLGWGHGRGMGQWGSLGYALSGWDYSRILDHFYGGTAAATDGLGRPILVHLSARSGADERIRSDAPFRIGDREFAAGTAVRMRPNSNGTYTLFTGSSCTGPWTELADVPVQTGRRPSGGTYQFIEASSTVVDPGDDPSQMLQLCLVQEERNVETRAFRGNLVLSRELSGSTWVANRLDLEDYLRGVVPRESPASWARLGDGKGVNALKAQAVAARSYVLALIGARQANGSYATDTCDTQACQVYGGAWVHDHERDIVTRLDHGGVNDEAARAVASTAGEIRRWSDDRVALAEYASSTGGFTSPTSEGNPFGAVQDLGDQVGLGDRQVWRRVLTDDEIEARWPSIGDLTSVSVTERNGLGAWGGRSRTVLIEGTAGEVELDSANWGTDTFRRSLGLRSDWYRFPQFDEQPDERLYVVKSTGELAVYGGGSYHGDARDVPLNGGIVDIAVRPSGRGYWLLGTDGGVFSYGDAEFYGSTGDIRLNQPVVGMAPSPTGEGYWFVASDGGVFSFGDAQFYGSLGSVDLHSPIVAMTATPGGRGYLMVGADGGVFTFGDAQFYGSIGGSTPPSPIVDIAPTPSGKGYWFVAADGTVYAFGDARDLGSPSGDLPAPIVDIAASRGGGYWLLRADGLTYSFGVTDFPTSRIGPSAAALAAR